jgi:hypothetical protein
LISVHRFAGLLESGSLTVNYSIRTVENSFRRGERLFPGIECASRLVVSPLRGPERPSLEAGRQFPDGATRFPEPERSFLQAERRPREAETRFRKPERSFLQAEGRPREAETRFPEPERLSRQAERLRSESYFLIINYL